MQVVRGRRLAELLPLPLVHCSINYDLIQFIAHVFEIFDRLQRRLLHLGILYAQIVQLKALREICSGRVALQRVNLYLRLEVSLMQLLGSRLMYGLVNLIHPIHLILQES